MKNAWGKAIVGTALVGTSAGCLALGLLYNSCSNWVATSKELIEEAKESKEKLADLEKQLEESAKAKAEAEKEKEAAVEALNKLQDAEVEVAPCEFIESNLDYKKQNEDLQQKVEALERALEQATKLSAQPSDAALNYQDVVKQLAGATEQIGKLKKQLEDQQSESKAATEHHVGMMADMADQYNTDKAKWDGEKEALLAAIRELESKFTDTITYYLNKKDNCQWHYTTSEGRYGKVCYADAGEISTEIWIASSEDNPEVTKKLQEQFESASPERKFKDGQSQVTSGDWVSAIGDALISMVE